MNRTNEWYVYHNDLSCYVSDWTVGEKIKTDCDLPGHMMESCCKKSYGNNTFINIKWTCTN